MSYPIFKRMALMIPRGSNEWHAQWLCSPMHQCANRMIDWTLGHSHHLANDQPSHLISIEASRPNMPSD
eukprot:3983575-Ditylum_brightwellii.AAC.1